ncbi:hypothetical protein F2Q69_00047249 [Brassica cretica]|uniref:CCHC-type domain-containing protein n=1 Tax=Brassica cretica TaxID=69181 RepID=A0A8S9PU26_BRACR|nr:hypothetical protein F2Q69_00047249 [Brassica cretica]
MEPTVHDVDDNPLLHMESHGVVSEESSESFPEPASPDILISDPDTEDGLTEVEEDDVPVFQEEMETHMAGSDLPIISSCVPDTDPTLVASGSVPSSVPPPTSLQREAPVSPDMVNTDVITLGRGQREKRRPTKLQDYYSTGSGNSGHSAGSGSSQQPYLTKEERMKQHCSSCGRNGHLASNCFCTLGYPEWWGELQRGKQSSGP